MYLRQGPLSAIVLSSPYFRQILITSDADDDAMSQLRFLQLTFCALAGAGLAGCATAPTPAGQRPTAPQAGVFASTLHLCDGDHIDNAPPMDDKKHILGYRPFTNIFGVTLALAPVRRGCFSSGFGYRHDRMGRHDGIDLSTGHSHAVYAAGDGVVEEMRTAGGYGKMILIRHSGRVETRYGHLSSYASNLHVGHDVRRGDVIGSTGRTGNAEA